MLPAFLSLPLLSEQESSSAYIGTHALGQGAATRSAAAAGTRGRRVGELGRGMVPSDWDGEDICSTD